MKKHIKLLVIGLTFILSGCSIFNKYSSYRKANLYEPLPVITGANKQYGIICNDNVKNLDIDYVKGSLSIEKTSQYDSVTILETVEDKIEDKYVCHYYHDESTYKLKYCKSNISIPNKIVKSLKVYIPENITLDSIVINCVSASINVSEISVNTLSIETVSGNVSLSKNDVKSIDVNSVSGTVEAILKQKTEAVNVNQTSGNTIISVPSTTGGYKATLKTQSGRYTSVFEDLKNYLDNEYLIIYVKSTSGDLSILQYESNEKVIERIKEEENSETGSEIINSESSEESSISENESERELEGLSEIKDSGSWGDLE